MGVEHALAGTGRDGETFFNLPDSGSCPAGIIQRQAKKKKNEMDAGLRGTHI